MADTGVGITPGSGANIAVDVVSSLKYQRIKIDVGAGGANVPLVGDATYGIPVDIKRFPATAVLVNNPTAGNLKVDASGVAVPVTDNSGSLTVDAPAATPVAVRLSTGSAFIDTIPVSGSVTAAQGSPAVAANRWLVQLHDGTTAAAVDSGTGGLKVYVAGGSLAGGTALADKATFTEGTSLATPIAGDYNDSPSDPSAGHLAAVRITQKRGLHVNLRAAAGTEIGTSGAPIRTDPTGSTIQPVSGTVTAQLKDDGGTAYSATNPLEVQRSGRKNVRVTNDVALTASQTAVTIWTPTSGKKFYIDKIILSVTTAGPLVVFDSTNASANILMNSGAGVNWPTGIHMVTFDEPWASATINNVLKYTSGAGLVAEIVVHGHEA